MGLPPNRQTSGPMKFRRCFLSSKFKAGWTSMTQPAQNCATASLFSKSLQCVEATNNVLLVKIGWGRLGIPSIINYLLLKG